MPGRASEITILATVFVIAFIMTFLDRHARLEDPRAIVPSQNVLFLAEGGTLDDLIGIFHELDFQFNEAQMRWAAGIKGWRSYLPGRYQMDPAYSYDELLSRLARGLQTPMPVRIVGGMEFDRFVQRVSTQFRLTEDELREAMTNAELHEEFGIQGHHLIGRMLPDTYQMYWTATPEQFLRRMMSEFDRAVVTPYKDRAHELGMSIDEITTLASIIEWEVRHNDEKARVSGLYWNRLNRRMRLQADPTVAYAIGERRRLLFADYRVQHPYNTYLFAGLPPGPINNPRISSIRAALYPESHNYLFMVATPDGYHTFTTNFDDHRRESRRWTSWLREQRLIRQQMEADANGASGGTTDR